MAFKIDNPPSALMPNRHITDIIKLFDTHPGNHPRSDRLECCFDILVSLLYAQKAISNVTTTPHQCGPVESINYICACGYCYKQGKGIIQCKSAKPSSAEIGALSSTCLIHFLLNANPNTSAIKPGEPDVIFYNKNKKSVTLCEIKAAPLLTFPTLKKNAGYSLFGFCAEFDLGMPNKIDDWALQSFYANARNRLSDIGDVIDVWIQAKSEYQGKTKSTSWPAMYWMTNGCGTYRSNNVSDGKTSAGLDRTDDIKKATYQAIKNRMTHHPTASWPNLQIAIASNLPALKHHSKYVAPMLTVKVVIPALNGSYCLIDKILTIKEPQLP